MISMNSIGRSLLPTRNKELFSEIVFILILILSCGSFETMNAEEYMSRYLEGGKEGDEWLYNLLCSFFYQRVDFKYFYFFIQATGLFLIRSTAKKLLGPYAWIFYILYFIFPLGENRSALRNTIVSCIIVFSFRYLMSSKLIDILKYVFCVAIATGIHTTAFIYLLFLLVYKVNYLKNSLIFKSAIIVLSLLTLFVCFNPEIIGYIALRAISYMSDTDVFKKGQDMYFAEMAQYGFIYYGFYQASWIICLNKLRKEVKKNQNNYWDKYKDHLIDVILFMDILLIFMLIGIKINSNFFRFFQNIVPLNYMALIILTKSFKVKTNTSKVCLIVSLLIFLYFGIQQSLVSFDENIVPMFTENWLLSFNF